MDKPLAAARQRLKKHKREVSTRGKTLAPRPTLKGRKYRPRAKKQAPVTIHLRRLFSINGQPYGPGKVVMNDHNIAMTLLNQDQKAEAAENKLYEKRAFIVRRQGIAPTQVPSEQFNELLGNVDPFATITEKAD